MSNNFSAVMAKRSNAELIQILTHQRDHYQADALLAAEEELQNRNLNVADVQSAETRLTFDNAIVEFNATRPLEAHWKVLAFLIPVITQLLISGIFKADGFHRKASEMGKWTLRGVLFYLGLFLLIIVLGVIFS